MKVIHHGDFNYFFQENAGLDVLLDEIFNDNYKIFDKGITFESSDIVVDIGANVGAFSILLAKNFPDISIYAIEPVPVTYNLLCSNLDLNNVKNVIPIHTAIGYNNGIMKIQCNQFLGGSSAYMKQNVDITDEVYVPVITLDNLFISLKIEEQCKLLKIDTEGAEYDILYHTNMLGNIKYVVGEFHENQYLNSLGYNPHTLANYISQQTNMLYYEICYMSE